MLQVESDYDELIALSKTVGTSRYPLTAPDVKPRTKNLPAIT